jgi:hypothetical protein
VPRLSKRQRQLYEEYMASGSTRATLASGNFLGIMNCLMQLRKVGCGDVFSVPADAGWVAGALHGSCGCTAGRSGKAAAVANAQGSSAP